MNSITQTMGFYRNVSSSDEFLGRISSQKITQHRLKTVLFGNIAYQVIRATRKDGQYGFDLLRQSGAIWYMACTALEAIDPDTKRTSL